METSYVLVKSEMGHEMEVMKELLALDLVKEARGTFGVYDIFVKIEANMYEQIENAITKQIRKMPYVLSTITLSVIPEQDTVNKTQF